LKILPISDEPSSDCALCPRLSAFRAAQRAAHPHWFNAPVPAFGDSSGALAIVGLAPGLQGANRTGRPFTGDHAGELLYATLIKFGFASGTYRATPDDGLTLRNAEIVNAVRCVPPANKPMPAEIRTCNGFLASYFAARPKLSAALALGRIAHDAVLMALGRKRNQFAFAHGARHDLGSITVFDSYHCSRYNTNTGVLTPAMFEKVFESVRRHIGSGSES
jgi:uracil-DNA glycosylase family 4